MLGAALFTRPVLRTPLRVLATVLGVAAGVASLVSTVVSSRAALASLTTGVEELAGANTLEVRRDGGLDEGELARLAPLATDAWIAPVVERIVLCPQLGDTVRLTGVDPLVDARVRAAVAAPGAAAGSGTSDGAPVVDFLRGRGAYTSAALAREMGLAPGGTIELQVAGRTRAVPLLGTFPAPVGAAALERLVLVDVALAQRWTGGRLDRIELVPRAGVDAAALEARAAALVDGGCRVGPPARRAAENAGVVRSLEFNLTALSGISLLVGGVLVATTLATSVVQRRRTISLLYALGASRAQIVRTLLLEGACIGLAGGVVGVLLGGASARFLTEGMRLTASTLVTSTRGANAELTWTDALIGVGLGLAAAVAASVVPILEGARTPPIQSLRAEAPAHMSAREFLRAVLLTATFVLLAVVCVRVPPWRELPVPALLGTLCLLGALFVATGPVLDVLGRAAHARSSWPVTVRLACTGLSAGRRRAAWAAGAVGMAVALSMAIATNVVSFRETLWSWTRSSLHADLAVRPPHASNGLPVGELDSSIVARIEEFLPGADVDPYRASAGSHAGARITIASLRYDVSARRAGSAMADGSDPRVALARARERGEVLVTDAGAHRFGWKTGDEIEFEAGGTSARARIGGVYLDYGDNLGIVLLDEPRYRALVPGDGPSFVDVYLPSGGDVGAARDRLRAALAPEYTVDVLDRDELHASVMSVFDQTFAITRALQAASTLVAILAVLTVLYALVAERSADLALLASLGASPGQVGSVVCVQAGLLGLVGAVGGVATGLVVGWVIVHVVNVQSFGWSLDFVPPWGTYASTVVIVGLACLAAGLVPARRALGGRLREALREE